MRSDRPTVDTIYAVVRPDRNSQWELHYHTFYTDPSEAAKKAEALNSGIPEGGNRWSIISRTLFKTA